MRTGIILLAFACLCICSCDNSDSQKEQPAQHVPEALQDNKSSYTGIRKRSGDNLVDELYDELVEKDEKLKALQHGINLLESSKADSTESINNFIDENDSYYKQADLYATNIKDSALKQKIKALIGQSTAGYHSLIAANKELLAKIDAADITLDDLHTALKVVKTLPVMEEYNKNNLPSVKKLKGYLSEQQKVISLADSLMK
ncbi:MAG: hypothetical protein DI535_13910 [Citrobacter freundii]|nr:MAG: hypothetical protein DI535_13910 [Citrobacter freundii]